MYGSLGLGFLGLTQCLVPGETGAAQVAGTRGNPRGQLVVCRQNGAHLVTACARPPGGKLGLVRVSRVSSVPGPGGGGERVADQVSGRDQGEIQEANLSDVDKVGST